MRMRLVAACLAAFAFGLPLVAGAVEVEDGVGRKVDVPAVINRVFAAGPPSGVLLCVLAPEKLVGFPMPLSDAAKTYLPPVVAAMPVVGNLGGRGSTASEERVAALHPDVILDSGTVNASYVSQADRVQSQTGIAYLLIDGRLADSPALLRKAAVLLGVRERGEALASYAEKTLAEVLGPVRTFGGIRPKVYYARSADGLETGMAGSISAELIDLLGAVNVAGQGTAGGIGRVSMEQILSWDPDVILAGSPMFLQAVASDPNWQSLRAVREGHVYAPPPSLPFGWIDGPPSVNRLIGLRWLAGRLYPDLIAQDLDAETRAFYHLFYGVDLNDGQLAALLRP